VTDNEKLMYQSYRMTREIHQDVPPEAWEMEYPNWKEYEVIYAEEKSKHATSQYVDQTA